MNRKKGIHKWTDRKLYINQIHTSSHPNHYHHHHRHHDENHYYMYDISFGGSEW